MAAKNSRIASRSGRFDDLNDPRTVKRFLATASAMNDRFRDSKKTARNVLVKEGILTKGGKLSKNYK